MIELLLKSSVAIGLALVFYKLVLQQESFFATNRVYLLTCIVLAFALPYISLPKMVEQQGYLERIFQKNASEEEVSKMNFLEGNNSVPVFESSSEASLPLKENEFKDINPVITTPSEVRQKDQLEQSPVAATETSITETAVYQNMGLWEIITLLYLFGVGIFSISLLFQLGTIALEIIKSRDKIRDGRYIIVNTSTPKAPCSFFNYIFIYPDDYDFEAYEQIIAHEKTHVRLRHSYDLLLAELAVIVLWFNPLIWLFKKEIEKNNEYQTDAVLIEKHKVRKEEYQLNLLQIAVPNKPLHITTNYNQSLIKQRIVMMNSKKSPPYAYWKYSFMLPLFFGMLLLLNEPALGQEQEDQTSTEVNKEASSSSEERKPGVLLERNESALVERPNSITRVSNEAIVREQLQDRAELAVVQHESVQERIAERNQIIQRSNSALNRNLQTDMTKGAWYSSIKNGKYCIEFRGESENFRWQMSDCYDKSAFQKKSAGTFVMTNEVGTLELKGNLDAEVGQGKYNFTENSAFRNFLTENRVSEVTKNNMFHLFLGDFSKDYVRYLKNQYSNVDGDELTALAIHGVKQDQFKNYVSLFENHAGGKAEIDDVLGLKIHGVTESYIKELQKMGFSDLSIDEIMSAKIHGVSAEYANSLRDAGFTNLSMNKIVSARIHGVNPKTIKEMKALGAQDIDKIIELQIHNVDAAYVNDLKVAGFGNLPMDKVVSAKIHDVNPETIKEMKALGAEDIDKIIELQIHNIDAAFVKDLKAAGLGDLNMDQIISAKIHGLNPTSIKEIKAMGFENLGFKDLLSGRIHGVDQAFIKDLKKAGFSNLSMDELVSAKIHGINSDFIEKARKGGYNLKTIDKYISLKIHGNAMESLKDN